MSLFHTYIEMGLTPGGLVPPPPPSAPFRAPPRAAASTLPQTNPSGSPRAAGAQARYNLRPAKR